MGLPSERKNKEKKSGRIKRIQNDEIGIPPPLIFKKTTMVYKWIPTIFKQMNGRIGIIRSPIFKATMFDKCIIWEPEGGFPIGPGA